VAPCFFLPMMTALQEIFDGRVLRDVLRLRLTLIFLRRRDRNRLRRVSLQGGRRGINCNRLRMSVSQSISEVPFQGRQDRFCPDADLTRISSDGLAITCMAAPDAFN